MRENINRILLINAAFSSFVLSRTSRNIRILHPIVNSAETNLAINIWLLMDRNGAVIRNGKTPCPMKGPSRPMVLNPAPLAKFLDISQYMTSSAWSFSNGMGKRIRKRPVMIIKKR